MATKTSKKKPVSSKKKEDDKVPQDVNPDYETELAKSKPKKEKKKLTPAQKRVLKELDKESAPASAHWWKFALLIILFIAAGWFLRYSVTNPAADLPDLDLLGNGEPVITEPEFTTVREEVDVDVSIENISSNLRSYIRQDVSLIGYIGHRFIGDEGIDYGPSGVNVYFVLDDFGNEIELSGVLGTLKEAFPNQDVSAELYEIKGRVQSSLGRTELVVSSIKRVPRPTKIIEKQVRVN